CQSSTRPISRYSSWGRVRGTRTSSLSNPDPSSIHSSKIDFLSCRDGRYSKLRGKDFLTLEELSPAELQLILGLSKRFKKLRKRLVVKDVLRGRTVALRFEKPSTRTRVSFQVAVRRLGAYSGTISW